MEKKCPIKNNISFFNSIQNIVLKLWVVLLNNVYDYCYKH